MTAANRKLRLVRLAERANREVGELLRELGDHLAEDLDVPVVGWAITLAFADGSAGSTHSEARYDLVGALEAAKHRMMRELEEDEG